MKRKFFILILLYFILPGSNTPVYSQDILPVPKKQLTKSSFVDCYPYKNDLIALTKDGQVLQIDLSDFSICKNLSLSVNISVIGKDNNGIIWAVDSFQTIYSYRDTGWKSEGFIIADKIWEIAFSKDNDLVLITDRGIYNSKTGMLYGLNKYRNRYSSFAIGRYRPVSFYRDDRDNLWMFHVSRRGNELHVFSIKQNRFITDDLKGLKRFWRIHSIFGVDKTIFLSEWDNYGMSALYSYKGDTVRRLHHPEYDTMTMGPSPDKEEYISAAFFDKQSSQIYYYAGNGVCKAKYNRK